MITHSNCFTAFNRDIDNIALPERFTFPFCYQPHPLCLLATEQLQSQLAVEQAQLFEQTGKMFGVLVVENNQGEIGYLSAFSGKLTSAEHNINFVPSIVDFESQTDFFNAESEIINRLNSELTVLLENPQLALLQQSLATMQGKQDDALTQHKDKMTFHRQQRKVERSHIKERAVNSHLSDEAVAERLKQLAQESINDKNELRDLKQYWHDKIAIVQQKFALLDDEINALKKKRKQLSTKLQKKLFKQYRLLNSAGVEKDLIELFESAIYPMPPAGTGDCAAPKLLQYAFKQQLTPLAIAEFWWGKPPKSAIRQHKNFYGACSGKCQPILAHMLEGMAIDDNPLLINPALNKELAIVYQDNEIVVVNKPNEFLSVPGKNIEDSVYLRIKEKFPQATGSLIVHRLDMSTSGLMVLALTKRAQKNLQQQFINRLIKKRYLAVLEGSLEERSTVNAEQASTLAKTQGEINLPLRGDLDDRPKQLVCFEHGKSAKTQWQIIETIAGKTKLYLYPETGRTHQLRVHCAHSQGLNMPILGDDLYGRDSKKAQRLHLQAQMLTLSHPVTKEVMTFEVAADF